MVDILNNLMDKIFESNEKHEIIVLSDLKDKDTYRLISCNQTFGYDYSDYSNEKKISALENKNKLKNESLKLYYKIDNEKAKELESTFKQYKLRIQFDSEPGVLRDYKLYSSTKTSFTIYDNKLFNKIIEIKFESPTEVISAIQLINNDLVIACDKNRDEYELLIYRIKDNKYFLFQKIKESGLGYKSKYEFSFCVNTRYKMIYKLKYLKEISKIRFMCISNYGFKIYSLNKKGEYSLILLSNHLEDIKIIHELNENEFIFCTHKKKYKLKEILIEIIKLKKTNKKELDDKLNHLKNFGYHINRDNWRIKIEDENSNIYDDELKKLIESLKLSCTAKKIIYDTSYNRYKYLSDYIILKKKYFIVMIDNIIFIYDIMNEKKMKRYEIVIDAIVNDIDGLFFPNCIDVKKWNNNDDNEFIFFILGNIILFELNEDGNDINLKIINCSYFQNFSDVEEIYKLSEKKNNFYSVYSKSENIISLY